MTIKQANKIAKQLGLARGTGTFNGAAYWKRPGSPAIITRTRIEQMAFERGLI